MKSRIVIMSLLLSAMLQNAMAQTGTWSGALDVNGTGLSLTFHLDGPSPTMDSPDQGAKDIPIIVDRPSAGKITIRIPSIGASFEGVWIIRQIVGTFTQMNMDLPLTLTPGEKKPRRPQTPSGDFPYTSEDISFNNGDVRLEGTLVLPEKYSRKTPVLVMVTGSGIQNRDEEIFDHKPFAVIADALARSGIATMRYDDRGYKGYPGNIGECTADDFKKDASAGIRLMRERFDNVGVLGHSEGGTIAMMIAAEHKADFIVSLAGMAVSGTETLLWQNRTALYQAGYSREISDSYCTLLSRAFEATIEGRPVPDSAPYDLPLELNHNYQAVVSQLKMPYMTHFLSLDIRPMLGQINCPVLALNGTKDIQVYHESNLDAIREGLPSNPKNSVLSVEGKNHLFQHCRTGSVAEYRTIEETIAPEVLELIASWISELFSL